MSTISSSSFSLDHLISLLNDNVNSLLYTLSESYSSPSSLSSSLSSLPLISHQFFQLSYVFNVIRCQLLKKDSISISLRDVDVTSGRHISIELSWMPYL